MKTTTKMLLIPILLLVSCSHYIINEAGYIRPPKHYKFTYRKKVKPLGNPTIIDTNAVYYLSDANFYRDSDAYKVNDRYLRFYADGRVKLQSTKTFPKINEVNDPDRGIVGYFHLKDSLVRIQLYSDIGGGSDQLHFGKIDSFGNLVLLHDNPRTGFRMGFGKAGTDRRIERKSYYNPLVYRKIYLEEMTYDKGNW
ncbi:hypothetical protein [Flavobacterium selenitireducens]|uniref:hypothetical protein n=1 Tax=Flavobacterium selenitireducens TaxID=2722704 RepID=UPI00168A59FC|nr:hypothetical protein [Flavobacterium selenitireducens]MBD3583300.1 hypothetical protein [Flavobacterium selenitireducens]